MSLWLLFPLGLIALLVGADLLVRGASRIALAMGLAPLVVGLTVVAMGTSSPELAISLGAAFQGNADIALGNVVGSNIANILLILGLVALIKPLVVNKQLVWLDMPILVAISLATWWFAGDGRISRAEGGLLLAGAIAYTVLLIWMARRKPDAVPDAHVEEKADAAGRQGGTVLNVVFLVAGLALLILGARWLVDAATQVATAWGLSELIIGLTIVAVGTSLPEIATSILSMLKGEGDLAVGNAVGSCLLNLLVVLGATALVAPGGVAVAESALHFDLPMMVAVAVAALPIFFTGHRIARWEGAVFLGYYAAYTAYLFMAATHHDALRDFEHAMRWFVVPLTVLTLLVSLWNALQARRQRTLTNAT